MNATFTAYVRYKNLSLVEFSDDEENLMVRWIIPNEFTEVIHDDYNKR